VSNGKEDMEKRKDQKSNEARCGGPPLEEEKKSLRPSDICLCPEKTGGRGACSSALTSKERGDAKQTIEEERATATELADTIWEDRETEDSRERGK